MRRPVLTIVLAFLIGMASFSYAQTSFSILYSFGGVTDDGISPEGRLVRDAAGNLYGTTEVGGKNGVGTVFKLTQDGAETLLYTFSLPPDAILPGAGLYRDATGNLYGTTLEGGTYGKPHGFGAVFKIDPSGRETVLHNFGRGNDGNYPQSELLADLKGILYGTTNIGGRYGSGTVFRISTAGRETVLHSFNGFDGELPTGALIRDAQGNFFGTTASGGAYGYGTVFKLAPSGKETVLYSFCATFSCPDGRGPASGLIQDKQGNLFGTTGQGGANGQGAVFKVTKRGAEIVLYSFGALGSGDGRWPFSGLILDPAGNLYGTTRLGGTHDAGTVFKLDPAGRESILHSFCEQPNCTDGSGPAYGSLVRDPVGNLYGVLGEGGAHLSGMVFKLTQ